MRRDIPTVLLLFVLLAVSGMAVLAIETGSGEVDTNLTRGLLLTMVAGVLGALIALVIAGLMIAFVVNRIALIFSDEKAATKKRAEPPASTSKPAPTARGAGSAPVVPLYTTRSRTVFYVVVGLGLLAFIILRALSANAPPGYPLDRLPDISRVLFELPGGIKITQGIGTAVLVLFALGGTLVPGIVLARVVGRLGKETQIEEERAKSKPEPAKTTATPADATKSAAAAAKVHTPAVPLYDNRSRVIFYMVVGVATVGFLLLRWLSTGTPLGYVPDLLVTPVPTPLPTSTRLPVSVPGGGAPDLATLKAEFEALPQGDATAGEAIFTSAACVACHSLEPGVKIVGPSQAGLATRAATTKPGYSAELYIYESILYPNASIAEGFTPDVMPKVFKDTLTPQNLADVIAFLLTLK
jgi:mono/diheme cytochrome c family protein